MGEFALWGGVLWDVFFLRVWNLVICGGGGGVLHGGLFGVLALLVLEGMRVMLGEGRVGNGGVIRELPAAVGMGGGLGSTLGSWVESTLFPMVASKEEGGERGFLFKEDLSFSGFWYCGDR